MEQHPIPQNITNFQFKLVGDMTLRQFGFMAGGIILGYLTLQLDWPELFKWPLAMLVGGSGFAFAFVPIEERSLDHWLVSFFTRIYSPTQFLWKKRAVPPEVLTATVIKSVPPTPETLKKEKTDVAMEEYLMSLPKFKNVGAIDNQETKFVDQVNSYFSDSGSSAPKLQTEIVSDTSVQKPEPKKEASAEELNQKTQNLTNKIAQLQKLLTDQEITQDKFLEIQGNLTELLKEKEVLTSELADLRKKLNQTVQSTAVKPTQISQPPPEPTVKVITPQVAPQIGMPKTSDIPNVISGIVKTQRNTLLGGVLIEIRNQEGTPVRALKTGKLGQFIVSTPLANGTYTLNLEDPQKTYHFDIIELTLTGEIVTPVEIFAKTEKDKIKEELKKKLFSQDNF